MSDHTITITLDPKNGRTYAEPRKPELWIGDTVTWVTEPPNLPFKVKFVDGSPFTHRQITTSRPRTVRYSGRKFFSRCFVRGRDGKWHGWTPEHPECGGEHDVRP